MSTHSPEHDNPRNILLKIEYDGTEFQGWQRQLEGAPTIQATIEDYLTGLLGRRIVLYASGRTDSGVHARAQYANFWVDSKFDPEQWQRILNFNLPPTIRILESREMPKDFHAQKQVISKTYEYRILNRSCASALDRGVYYYPRKLEWDLIREAMTHFVGEKDFASFRGSKTNVKTTIRNILRFELNRHNPELYVFEIEGTGFLKQMVRTIMGTLIDVGEKRTTPARVLEIIAARDRRVAGRTLSGSGLYLAQVKYPERFGIH